MELYSWQVAFDRLEEQGPMRVIRLFKIGLQEMPRLEKTFLSGSPDEQKKARNEILAIFHRISLEMQKAIQESGLAEDDFTKQVQKKSNFTSDEWAQLARVPELIGRHHNEIFAKKAFNTSKKRNPFFKV